MTIDEDQDENDDQEGRDLLYREYFQCRREDASTQRTLMTLMSIAVAISAALFTFMEDHSGLLNDKAKTIGFGLWLALPLIPIGLVGWILYEALRMRVRRGYLYHLECAISEKKAKTSKDVTLQHVPLGFRVLDHLARPHATTGKRGHWTALFIVILGMAVFMLLFGGMVAFFIVEAWRSTTAGSFAFYTVTCGLALGVLLLAVRDDGDLFERAFRVVRGENPT
jgi:hypothetical protein